MLKPNPTMPQEICDDLFRLKIPLPESPLKFLNCYVIKGASRSMIVDTGLNRTECLSAMRDGLDRIGVDLDRSDFFITHFHEDHFGLVGALVHKPCKVYFNCRDLKYIDLLDSLAPMIRSATRNGCPGKPLRELFAHRTGLGYGNNWRDCIKAIHDNDVVRVGNYRLRCIHTPGHSMGHTCLYDQQRRILLSGDHVLGDISPNITCWFEGIDPLKAYLQSLDKITPLPVSLVLPGHREPFRDLKPRLTALAHHHRSRLHEIMTILENNPWPHTAFDVASKMKWDIDADSWAEFPLLIKFFATGEAVAHLRYLVNDGRLCHIDMAPVSTYAIDG
ncbi:hypothetical protein DSCO28_15820 [Desulfosarcina ovata subsp. sediminis]|uniref:Metallo-beta-lactamase domain-containing protein n=2 Tax=Desulfosarcina ovata TaxID=83564 RepID=A0A5K7ZJ38_9BACT|nr:hypothetical protein DSCO28_15820 [Desulfosarcina ovata subsp. sediminis]